MSKDGNYNIATTTFHDDCFYITKQNKKNKKTKNLEEMRGTERG